MTHKEAEAKFKKCRNKERGYLLATHTRLQKRGRAFAVRYHETDVVMIRLDNTYRLNSGGWRTVTTKNRMNNILPSCSISQTKGIWHIDDNLFFDGILIGNNGKVVNGKKLFTNMTVRKSLVDNCCEMFIQTMITNLKGRDIGAYTGGNVPQPSSRGHINQLWKDISESTTSFQYNPRLSKYLRMAIEERNFSDKGTMWVMIREDFLNYRNPLLATSAVKSFINNRRAMIVDQMEFGNMESRSVTR